MAKRLKPNAGRIPEILTGIVRGHGRKECCLVYAVREVAFDRTGGGPYRDLRIRDLPGDLDDGNYTLELNGATFTLKVQANRWTILEADGRELRV